MFSIYFTPHLALDEFVESVCVMGHDFRTTGFLSPIYTFMPSHTRYLCFYLEDRVAVKKNDGLFDTRSRALIIGPQLTPVTMNLKACPSYCYIKTLRIVPSTRNTFK